MRSLKILCSRGTITKKQAIGVKGTKASSTRWLQRQLTDQFVRRAKEEGAISRAAFKLQEIQERFKFMKPGDTIIDLGSSPGGWTKCAYQYVHPKSKEKKEMGIIEVGKVISVDIKGLQLGENIRHGLHFIRKDFTLASTQQEIVQLLDGKPADAVLSDMYPVPTGDSATDHANAVALATMAFEFSKKVLKKGGYFLAKVTRGGDEDRLRRALEQSFESVKAAKPEASRADSPEIYFFAIGHKHQPLLQPAAAPAAAAASAPPQPAAETLKKIEREENVATRTTPAPRRKKSAPKRK